MTRRTFNIRPSIAALLIGGSALAGTVGGAALAQNERPIDSKVAATGPAAVARGQVHASLADMVDAVGPSVVQIKVLPQAQVQRLQGHEHGLSERERFLRRFYGHDVPDRREAPSRGAVGSGFVIDASGLIVTNNHVVAGADAVIVQLSDGRELTGRVLGRDDKTDIAVVKIDGAGRFQAIAWGDSDVARVGDSVFAVGSPFGLGNTVTSGIVSARGREIGAGPYDDFLQVDAAINSGNSGGPLFDAYGRVVGVNTAIFSPSGGNVGIGFAIPARIAREVAMDIVENGSVSRGRIGVSLSDVTSDAVRELGLDKPQGALIAQVDAAGTAARSGLRPGDVIRRFGSKTIEDGRDLARAVADAEAGSTIAVELIRQGRRFALDLAIGSDAGIGA